MPLQWFVRIATILLFINSKTLSNGLGLKEAKDAVDSAPCILDRWVTVEEFHTIRDWIIGQDDRFADNIRLNL